ncbi:MAG: lysophospholipase [Oscillospiraceae bacterium]|nr:lysophospholipase [Oscillospiraceae bacterium]
MPSFREFNFASTTGSNKLYAVMAIPDGEVRGVVQIAHGVAEYIDRYRPFMEFLAQNGFVAVGNDHLGHGRSITVPEEQGFFAEKNGWQYVLDDMAKLHKMTAEQYPGLPYIFFGHSMGSFLTRHYVILHPDEPTLTIICGTGHQLPAMVAGGNTMAKLGVALCGPRKIGKLLNKVAFGSYCKDIPNPRTDSDWLNRDPAQVDKYISDPLCGFVPTVSLFRDMMGGVKFITDPKHIALMNKKTPVLFIAGGEDPVGERGEGVKRAAQAFKDAGIQDVSLKLYPGARHEILLETNREEVFGDVVAWINEKLG